MTTNAMVAALSCGPFVEVAHGSSLVPHHSPVVTAPPTFILPAVVEPVVTP